jgi:hypothetical protein
MAARSNSTIELDLAATDQYHLPMHSALIFGSPVFNLGQLTEVCP